MLVIRACERAVRDARMAGRFEGPVHVSLGQEAVAVGLGAALRDGDLLVSNHRGHGHALAFGLDARRVLAEIVGHPSGYAGGRGGSMHILAPEVGFLGTNGIVGDGAAIGIGAALAQQQRGQGGVAAAVVGDGAMGTGVVYESMNLAVVWHLPFVLVCEHNGYAEMTPTAVHLSTSPATRAEAFGMEVVTADGTDATVVADAIDTAIRAAAAGRPSFVEARCYRWEGHYVGDVGHYRPEGEDETWQREYDPVARLAGLAGLDDQELNARADRHDDDARGLLASLLGELDGHT